jgi:hypothetical protein
MAKKRKKLDRQQQDLMTFKIPGWITRQYTPNGVGQKAVLQPIPYGKVLGHRDNVTVITRHPLYKPVEQCDCYICEKGGGSIKLTKLVESGVIELVSDIRTLKDKYLEFVPYGSHPKQWCKGIVKILRLMQADTKGPWTTTPFLFNGRLVKPGKNGWHIERFDRFTRTEQHKQQPVNQHKQQKTTKQFDDKLGFEDKAQMSVDFEARFSK